MTQYNNPEVQSWFSERMRAREWVESAKDRALEESEHLGS